ncbi:MAG: helix-turn-helix domain-containing protein [Acidobacteria bacterium]|nr:helix-turn-helix domain-containing protein [Acidobacteriota bacterium]
MKLKAEILQLSALRLSRGISLEAIADQTKISVYYLRAIEDWDLAKLPGGVYRDNFIKQYAGAIDTDLAEELSFKLAKASREEAESEASSAAQHSLLRSIKETIARGATLLFLLGSAGTAWGDDAPNTAKVRVDDPRYQALRNFFDKYKCPITNLAGAFLEAADRHGLDWRLLPSIVFLETGGGKQAPLKNLMGWNSGRTRFQTQEQGIHFVAERLANAPIYAGKDTRTKLRIYNPANKQYAQRVLAVMEQLMPSALASR